MNFLRKLRNFDKKETCASQPQDKNTPPLRTPTGPTSPNCCPPPSLTLPVNEFTRTNSSRSAAPTARAEDQTENPSRAPSSVTALPSIPSAAPASPPVSPPSLPIAAMTSQQCEVRRSDTYGVGEPCPIFKERIFFLVTESKPAWSPNFVTFTTDETFIYHPFCDDFGPLNLGTMYRFYQEFKDIFSKAAKPLLMYTKNDFRSSNNAAFLLACFLMLELEWTADEAWKPFEKLQPCPFRGYHDATFGPTDFTVSVLDCLRGLQKAMVTRLIDLRSPIEEGGFDVDEYEHYDDPLNGDLHIVVPGKFVAFKGPVEDMPAGQLWRQRNQLRTFHPKFYIPIFRALGVNTVVRLNEQLYDGAAFEDEGLEMRELYFDDCTTPPAEIMLRFLQTCEEAGKGAVAVHCKAGLGRTGTLIGLWLMKAHRFTAREAIGWLRIVRPGSVIGEQQQYLCDMQDKMWRIGSLSPAKLAELFSRASRMFPSSPPTSSPPSNTPPPKRRPAPPPGGGRASLAGGSDTWPTLVAAAGGGGVPEAARLRAQHGSEADYAAAVGGCRAAAARADQLTQAMDNRAQMRALLSRGLRPLPTAPAAPASTPPGGLCAGNGEEGALGGGGAPASAAAGGGGGGGLGFRRTLSAPGA